MRHLHPAVLALALSASLCGIAQGVQFTAPLSGPAEFPANASPGTGFASVIYDPAAHTLQVDATFSGLLGNTTAAHIHAPVPLSGDPIAGVATQTPSFTGFPLGVTSGTYSHLFDLTDAGSFNSSYVTANGGTAAGAEAALVAAMEAGRAYFNIHTTAFGGGEIRGFLTVPEGGATVLLLGLGLAVVGVVRRFSGAK